MKKVISAKSLTYILLILGVNLGGICYAENDFQKFRVPDVMPIYDSYYDYFTNQLCIYSAEVNTVISVRVSCCGKEVLFDHVSPE